MGRPHKPPGEVRSIPLGLRLTPQEAEAIDRVRARKASGAWAESRQEVVYNLLADLITPPREGRDL